MKVLLVNPTLRGEIFTQHLGLTYVASYVNARTPHRAAILDFAFRRRQWQQHLKARLEREQPDLVGITVTAPNISSVKKIIGEVRSLHPRLPILLGGTLVTVLPEEAARLGPDMLCVGEGEMTLADLLDDMAAGRDGSAVPGIRLVSGGRPGPGGPRPVNQALDDLPFLDWDLWEDIDVHLKVYGMLSFYGTRGCPYDCSYCSAHAIREKLPGHFRLCGPSRYVDHLQYQWNRYRGRGLKVAWLWDQVFTYSGEWLGQFAEEYRRRGMDRLLPYSIYARADELDEERVRLLKESGCVVVRIGFESGDERILNDVYRKETTLESYYRAAELLRKAGISLTGYYILGGPGETLETVKRTFELARRVDADTPTFYVYKPLPATRALETLKALGGSVVDLWPKKVVDIRFGGMVYTPHLTPRQVERLQTRFILYFIPRLVLKQMRIWKLKYFTRLISYWRLNRRYGLGLVDILRNYTYMTGIEMQMDRRFRRARGGGGGAAGRPGPPPRRGGGPPRRPPRPRPAILRSWWESR
ncbi:MAG: B12-binding domain-containing radical SAM protein, partial [Acetobacteraceae bacterium]|nr:B12-binding domain-containing radical SAM protein [Acetobacteraceae bacterium]